MGGLSRTDEWTEGCAWVYTPVCTHWQRGVCSARRQLGGQSAVTQVLDPLQTAVPALAGRFSRRVLEPSNAATQPCSPGAASCPLSTRVLPPSARTSALQFYDRTLQQQRIQWLPSRFRWVRSASPQMAGAAAVCLAAVSARTPCHAHTLVPPSPCHAAACGSAAPWIPAAWMAQGTQRAARRPASPTRIRMLRCVDPPPPYHAPLRPRPRTVLAPRRRSRRAPPSCRAAARAPRRCRRATNSTPS